MTLASLLSAAAVPVQTGDRLRVRITNLDNSSHTVFLRTLIERPNGSLDEALEQIIATSGATTTSNFNLMEGRLISVTLTPSGTPQAYGLLFADVSIQQGSVSGTANQLLITSGYITGSSSVIFPAQIPYGGRSVEPSVYTRSGTDPAAGANFTGTIATSPGSGALVGGSAQLICDSNAANRRIRYQVWNGSSAWTAQARSRTNQIADETKTYIFWQGAMMPDDNNDFMFLPLPTTNLSSNTTITLTVENIQAGDQLTSLHFLVKNATAA